MKVKNLFHQYRATSKYMQNFINWIKCTVHYCPGQVGVFSKWLFSTIYPFRKHNTNCTAKEARKLSQTHLSDKLMRENTLTLTGQNKKKTSTVQYYICSIPRKQDTFISSHSFYCDASRKVVYSTASNSTYITKLKGIRDKIGSPLSEHLWSWFYKTCHTYNKFHIIALSVS